jgi:hypothetical protein
MISIFVLAGALASAAAASSPLAPDPAGCTLAGQAGTPADRALAIAACEGARLRFGHIFGDPVPAVTILLRDEPGYRVRLLTDGVAVLWATGAAQAEHAAAALASPGGAGASPDGTAVERHVDGQWRDVLPHEITHGLLAARFYPQGFGDAAGYGTPLPDWLDEGLAILAESPEHVAGRLRQARALPAAWRELRAILASPHPALANSAAFASRDGAPLPPDAALYAFYPQSVAVVEFVREAGGRDALLTLVRRLVMDPERADALAGLPGLPATMDGVVADWDRWLGPPPVPRGRR